MEIAAYVFNVMSVYCSLVATRWERAYLLGCPVYDVFLCFVTFPYGVLGRVWYSVPLPSSVLQTNQISTVYTWSGIIRAHYIGISFFFQFYDQGQGI